MFKGLRKRWQVSTIRVILILITFTIGGSLCGWLGRQILLWLGSESGVTWLVSYILIVTLLWPVCVLIISVLTGQYRFFSRYILRMIRRFSRKRNNKTSKLAIFASGNGSNAKNIIEYFDSQPNNKVAMPVLVVTNNPNAGVVQISKNAGLKVININQESFRNSDGLIKILKDEEVEYVILAGFLWKIPKPLIEAFPNRILNIHPALLPKFGGKGMFGHHIHEAVIRSGESESGITIHLVDEIYDHGKHLYQEKCPVEPGDDPETLAARILKLEHSNYPKVIKEYIQNAKS